MDNHEEETIKIDDSSRKEPHTIIFSYLDDGEILKITEEGFYIYGKKVPQDADEAQEVYSAFCSWLKKANEEEKAQTIEFELQNELAFMVNNIGNPMCIKTKERILQAKKLIPIDILLASENSRIM